MHTGLQKHEVMSALLYSPIMLSVYIAFHCVGSRPCYIIYNFVGQSQSTIWGPLYMPVTDMDIW